jgi:hypothetical protein
MKNEKERIASSGIFPNTEQTILLKACLLSGPDSIEAFHEWLQIINIPSTMPADKSALGLPQFFDKLDLGSQRLLSMLYKNLKTNKVKHPLIPKLEGYYKYVWYRNQVLMAELRKLEVLLSDKGIEIVLRKGLYMITRVYKDFGTRPTVDIDIAVRKEDWIRTVLIIEANGWKPMGKSDPNRISLSLLHAFPYENNNFELDLHYDFTNYPIKDQTKEQIWSKLNKTEGFNSLSKSNEMYLTLIHGYRVNIVPPIRWVADSVLLFRQFEEGDWNDFIKILDREKRKSVSIMLAYLQSNQFILFPARIQEHLRIQESLKFDLYDRTVLTKYNFYLDGIIRCYAYSSISNPGSFRKILIKWLDRHLWLWDKEHYSELILHVIIRFPTKVFQLFKKAPISKLRKSQRAS